MLESMSPFATTLKIDSADTQWPDKKPELLPVRAFLDEDMQFYLFAGGKSVQLPCATSAAMPMLSPSVGCG